MAKFGEIIKILRMKRGITQDQLAEAVHMGRSAIGNYEQGIREPDLDTVEAFADYFDVSIDDLLGRDELTAITKTPMPKTAEAKILSAGVDRMPASDRERLLSMVRLMFDKYADYFERTEDNDSES